MRACELDVGVSCIEPGGEIMLSFRTMSPNGENMVNESQHTMGFGLVRGQAMGVRSFEVPHESAGYRGCTF